MPGWKRFRVARDSGAGRGPGATALCVRTLGVPLPQLQGAPCQVEGSLPFLSCHSPSDSLPAPSHSLLGVRVCACSMVIDSLAHRARLGPAQAQGGTGTHRNPQAFLLCVTLAPAPTARARQGCGEGSSWRPPTPAALASRQVPGSPSSCFVPAPANIYTWPSVGETNCLTSAPFPVTGQAALTR